MRMRALALAILVLAGAPAAAQTREQKLDAVAVFKRFFKKWKETAQRVEAVHELERADCPEAVEALLPVLKHREPEVRKAAMEVLSGFHEPETFKAVLDSLPDLKDPEQRALLIEVLSKARVRALRKLLAQIWESDRRKLKMVERYAIARAYQRLSGKGFEDLLLELSRDKEFEVRVAALDAIRDSRLKSLGPKILDRLHDPVWQVREAAIKCFAVLRTFEAVDPLIEMLKTEGRLRIDASEALFKITAYDFGDDYKMWRKQWDRLSKIPGFRLPTDEELKKAEENRKKYAAMYGKSEKAKKFAGIPTTSTRILFVIDVSASMDDLVVEREKFKGYPSFQKLAIVKTELMNTIKSLDRNTWFNILAFATKVKAWKKFLVPATVSYKAAALSFVKSLKPLGTGGGPFSAADGSGKTNTYAALMRAFDMDPGKDIVLTGRPNAKALKLDTIYFLTDGRPSIGKYVDPEDILEQVRKINETRRIVIHCISIGDFEASFLKNLAAQNGGVFVDLGH